MINLLHLLPTVLILATCVVSYIGFTQPDFFQRYLFNIGDIRYKKQYFRLISSGFLHADWMHLLFNMLTLYCFMPVVVGVYGVLLFLLLYFAAMLAGNIFSLWLYKHRPTYSAIGASGAVSGIIFASIALHPLSAIYLFFIPIPIPAWIFAALYFAYSVSMMLRPRHWDNTGHSAHLGGAVVGMLFVAVLTPLFFIINLVYIGIMSLPLLYLTYEIICNKKAR